MVTQKLQNKWQNLFGSEPYSGWSSSIKPSCIKTENVAPQRKSIGIKWRWLNIPPNMMAFIIEIHLHVRHSSQLGDIHVLCV